MLSLKIKKNVKGLRDLQIRINRINKDQPQVLVGIMSDAKARSDDSDLTNAEIGAVHEYGADDAGIPARPWLRPGVEKNHKLYQDVISKGLGKELEGKSALTKTLALVGAKAAADVKNYVTRGPSIPPPLAEATVKRKQAKTRKGSKGSVRALVDTMQMVGSVTYKVTNGGAKPSQKGSTK